jgi:hypothetical protein
MTEIFSTIIYEIILIKKILINIYFYLTDQKNLFLI